MREEKEKRGEGVRLAWLASGGAATVEEATFWPAGRPVVGRERGRVGVRRRER